jgi:type I restriction enzyme, S subunit
MNVPDGWKKERASKLFNIQGGFAFKSTDAIQNSKGIRWLKIANVGLGNIKWDEQSYLPVDYLQKHSNFCLNVGDIVVAMTRPLLSSVLKIAQLSKNDAPSLLNQRVGRIIPKEYVIKEFLFHLFKTRHLAYQLESDLLGTDPPNLSIKTFKNIFFLLPPLPEQKAIADLLSTWDEAIEKTEQLIQAKEKRFYALLSKFISDNGQLTTRKIDWKKVKLGAVCKVITSNVDKKTLQNETLVRLCNYMDVYKNFYITSAMDFMEASATTSEILKFHLKKNDVLLTKDSETPDDIANSACVIEDLGGVLCGYHLSILRPMQSIEGAYLNFALHTPRIRYEFSRQANGATRFGLTIQAYNMVEIPLPPLEEQKQIAETLSTAQREIDLLKHLAEKYKTQKRGLMQKLLTGEWRIKPEILNKYKEA